MRTLQALGFHTLKPEIVRALLGPQIPARKTTKNTPNPELMERIVALRAVGMTYREIARQVGVSISTVNRYCV